MAVLWGVKGVFDITGKIVKMVIVAIRLVFMGTPEFSVPSLAALVLKYQVVAVYTRPDKKSGRGQQLAFSPVKQLALSQGLQVVQPTSLKVSSAVEQLAGLGPHLVVVAAYGQILPPKVLALPNFGCINIHPSLLPKYRGSSPVSAAILKGDEFAGVTIMAMDAGLDSGPILSQRQVTISPEDTTGSLTAKLAQAGAQLLMETLPLWLQGQIKPQPQDASQATYTKTVAKEDGEMDWKLPAVELWRQVRAYDPWPGCYTWWQGKRLKISQAVPIDGGKSGKVGEVVALPPPAPAAVGVQTGDGVLGLLQVQLEGKRDMSAQEFILGHRDFMGSLLL
jgi:methionyl-tRNA formyltransferase